MKCTADGQPRHYQKKFHGPWSCLHQTPNNLPCDVTRNERGKHDPQSLQDRTFGLAGDQAKGKTWNGLDVYMPVMCPLCPLEKRGVDWKRAIRQIEGETQEQYYARASKILGYEFRGQKNDQFIYAVSNIYEKRADESDIEYNTRVSVFRWSMLGLVGSVH